MQIFEAARGLLHGVMDCVVGWSVSFPPAVSSPHALNMVWSPQLLSKWRCSSQLALFIAAGRARGIRRCGQLAARIRHLPRSCAGSRHICRRQAIPLKGGWQGREHKGCSDEGCTIRATLSAGLSLPIALCTSASPMASLSESHRESHLSQGSGRHSRGIRKALKGRQSAFSLLRDSNHH